MDRDTTPRRHGTLTPAVDSDQLITVSTGPVGEAVALWAAPADVAALVGRREDSGGASFPDTRADRPVEARITVHLPELVAVTRISVELAYPIVQPLPLGRYLVAGSRCHWRAGGPERNAVVYDADGGVVATGTLGDGIEEVLTTPDGDIWVGYFDEGVFGNYGWGGPGPAPVGESGLVRFGPDLRRAWEFPSGIADCYALNVTGETAWACYYTDFPVARVEDGRVRQWQNDLAAGARALITGGDRVALFGGYGDKHRRVAVGALGEDGVHALGKPRRLSVPRETRLIGRGPTLDAFSGTGWFRLSLDDL